MVLIRYSNRFNCLKRKKTELERRHITLQMKPFIKDLTFRAEKKLPKANLHLFQNLKKTFTFS